MLKAAGSRHSAGWPQSKQKLPRNQLLAKDERCTFSTFTLETLKKKNTKTITAATLQSIPTAPNIYFSGLGNQTTSFQEELSQRSAPKTFVFQVQTKLSRTRRTFPTTIGNSTE